ncbi:hypothetical protein [Streptomyces sp. NPDC093970]|uniref:hypothetical protein n=1 Tax=unclassified Streptomyces TaxID=2593676 RepID=UPI00342CEA0A
MTPRPRSTTGGVRLALPRLLLVLATVLLPYGTAVAYDPGPVVAHDPEAAPSPSGSASASPSPEPSRAGSPAGEGRLRPGRPQGPAAAVQGQNEDDDEDETGTTGPSAGSAPPSQDAGVIPGTPRPNTAHQAAAPGEDDGSEPVLHILPLGSGLILIGLGFGLAFVALRVRRS